MNVKEQAILDAAEKIFAANGFKEASIREISRVAMVSSAMLNYYFHSKEMLLKAVLERRISRFSQNTSQCSQEPVHAKKKMIKIINQHIKVIAKNTSFFRFILRENLISSSDVATSIINNYLMQRLDAIKEVLAEGVENGDFKPLDIELTCMAISGAYVNCLVHYFYFSCTSSPENLEKRLIAFFEDYIDTLSPGSFNEDSST